MQLKIQSIAGSEPNLHTHLKGLDPSVPSEIEVPCTYEPRREKTDFSHMRKQRRRSACGNREADQRLCFRYTDSTIPQLPKSEILSL